MSSTCVRVESRSMRKRSGIGSGVLILCLGLCLFLVPRLWAKDADHSPSAAPSNTAQAGSVASQASQIPRGTAVEIRLKSGQKIRGRMVGPAEDHVVVQWLNGSEIENRKIALTEIKSLKVRDGKPSRTKIIGRYLLGGALGGAVGVVELTKENP